MNSLIGRVVSDKADKTISVRIDRSRAHRLYHKQYTVSHKISVHDPENKARVGDKVEIEETRPVSKTKSWQLVKVLEKTEKVGDK